ncbi:MAG: 50S ribosomal protein L4 [Bacteroidales bacterium]|nr:50S ribosomal protein L4 [Bacteroidales bacterium]
MELEVYNINGQKTDRKVNLNDAIFGIEPNDHAIYLDTKQYMANHRQGTHSAKERNAITGSTKKIKRQKGTGTARSGDIKSPLFRGGGRTFGPRPRDYRFKLNKKLKQLARKSALAYKVKDEGIMVIEDFKFDTPKTKNMVEVLNKLKINNQRTLLVYKEGDSNLYLSSRNLQDVRTVKASNLNTYDILHAQKLVLLEGSLEEIESILGKN